MSEGQRPVEQKIVAEAGAEVRNVRQIFIEQVTLGIRSLPTDYSTRIANFISEYLGTPGSPVPFGGREEVLQALDRWLDDPAAPPYLLLAAPAGRGKSALLVRWLERLRQRSPDLPVVFVPVSLRHETASQAVFFAALAARLAYLFGDKVPADLNQAPVIWRGMVSSYLSRPAPNGRLLVVLDGLDEATDWQAGPDLFPFQPPPGLRVVVSARYLAGESGPEDWLRRLGWERHGLARSMDLMPLTRKGVAEVLQSMGFPLDELGRRVDIVAELHRLSDGDPLLVRLYVDELWEKGEEAARLQPEDLSSLRPGIEDYFKHWWEYQRKQWGDKAPLKEQAVREVLNLLAAALAPLGQEDLLTLSGLDTWTLEEALQPLARLVIGDGKRQGYAFSHPRLGQYFWEKLSEGERQKLNRRFLDWGLECVERLRRGEIAPRDVPPYLVRALGSHLERAKAGPEDWLRLVHGAWAAASEALEGAYSLFLHDVVRAWRACAAADMKAASAGEPAPYLGGEILCALVEASIHSLAGNIHPDLLAALVEKRVWTQPQGLAYVRQISHPKQRAKALTALASQLTELDCLQEALATAKEMEEELACAEALATIALQLAKLGYPQEALAAAREIKDEWHRAQALAALAQFLLPELLPEALAATREIKDEWGRAQALADLAQQMPELLPEALAAAKEIKDEWLRSQALADLAQQMPLELLPELLAAVREIKDEWDRARALADLVQHTPPELLPEALTTAREIKDASARAQVLIALAQRLPGLLPEALAAAREIKDERFRAKVLADLAQQMPELLPEALAAAREIKDEWLRSPALADLAQRLPPELLPELLAAAREIEYKWDRAQVLIALAQRLPPELLPELLAAAREIKDERFHAKVLADLAQQMPELLPEALAAAREIKDEWLRSLALADLAQRLPPELLPELLAAAREIKDAYTRAQVLVALVQRLPELLPEALATTREIKDAYDYALALVALAPLLAELPRPALYPIWDETLPVLARRKRPNLLAALQALAKVIYALGGAKAVAETARAIQDVGHWWP